jgi:hypothetical protein
MKFKKIKIYNALSFLAFSGICFSNGGFEGITRGGYLEISDLTA